MKETEKTNQIQVFEFGGRRVRTAGTHDAPLFCAADVCLVLGYADVSQACEKLDQDEVVQIGAEKGSRRVLYVGAKANMFVTLGHLRGAPGDSPSRVLFGA